MRNFAFKYIYIHEEISLKKKHYEMPKKKKIHKDENPKWTDDQDLQTQIT